jgi:hypothetical protein
MSNNNEAAAAAAEPTIAATATPRLAAAAPAQSSDARMIAKQTAYIAQQKAKIEEWRRTVTEYKAWHERSVAALKARHQRDLQKQAAQLAQAQKELAERDGRIERMEKEARRMRAQLQRHEEKAQAALDDTVTSDAEAEEDDADSVSHLNSSGSGSDSSFDSPDTPRQDALAVAVQHQQETSSSLVRSGLRNMQLAPQSAFPRALTVADNASVDEHVTNLFAQVSALRGRLAGLKRTVAVPVASTRSTISSSTLQHRTSAAAARGAAVADDHQPQLRWHVRTKSTSTTSLKAGPDGRTAPVLNTTVRSCNRSGLGCARVSSTGQKLRLGPSAGAGRHAADGHRRTLQTRGRGSDGSPAAAAPDLRRCWSSPRARLGPDARAACGSSPGFSRRVRLHRAARLFVVSCDRHSAPTSGPDDYAERCAHHAPAVLAQRLGLGRRRR